MMLTFRTHLLIMIFCSFSCTCVMTSCSSARATSTLSIPAIDAAMTVMIAKHEISGAVTGVITKTQVAHLSAVGLADIATDRAMQTDQVMWIASMTKPITATAILMLQDEGKLSVTDPVEKYIPEFSQLATADGKKQTITLHHLLTHSSGLSESTGEEKSAAKKLADLIPGFTSRPLKFTPGAKWAYCQSGMNSLGRIVEIVSGTSFPIFLQQRIFDPLQMVDTTFYPNTELQKRLATVYKKEGDSLLVASLPKDFDPQNSGHYPAANGGLFSTASDYMRFCQLLLNEGTHNGQTLLSTAAMKQMRSLQSGELQTGFTPGNGWGLGVCVVREPQGVSEYLSAGSFGHGGAYGTQAWIDPVKGVAYVLLVQRQNFPNSDNSDVRRAFQAAAYAGLTH